MPEPKVNYIGFRWMGQRLYLESTGMEKVDDAMKTTFCDDWRRTAPLTVTRADCKLVLAWSRGEIKNLGEYPLFKGIENGR